MQTYQSKLINMGAEPDVREVAATLFVSVGLGRRRLRQQQAPGDLTFPETAALARLDRCGAATSAQLAREEQISPQSMGATLGALQDRGLVDRHADPADGRRVVLTITAKGLAALRERRSARVDQLADGMADFSAEELRQLMVAAPLLERLARSL